MRFSEVPALVRAHEQADNPVMLWSPPGIGKSALVRQLCDGDGIKNIDIRLSLLNPVDLRGIPVVQGDKVMWVPPVFLVKQGPCRFFCDEINVAPPATQACAYQWFLDKRIGEWEMDTTLMKTKTGMTRPAQTIVAAGNRASDQAFVHQMPAPLRNRMAHIEVEAHFDDWRDWAYKAGVHRYVINFLTYTARIGVEIKGLEDSTVGLLFFFDPKQHTTGSFPSPRSWEMTSRFITKTPQYRVNTEAIAGMVGAAVATKFTAFVKVADELPNAEEVLKGKKLKAPTEPSAQYAFCGALAAALIRSKKEDRVKATQNVAAYCVDEWGDDAEFAVLTMKDFGRTPEYKEVYRQVIVTKEWTSFTKTFGELLEN